MNQFTKRENDPDRLRENLKNKGGSEPHTTRHILQSNPNNLCHNPQIKNKETSEQETCLKKTVDQESSFESIPSKEAKPKMTKKMKLNQALSDRALDRKELILPMIKSPHQQSHGARQATSNDPPIRPAVGLKLQPIVRKMS